MIQSSDSDIEVPVWVKRGTMMVNRSALNPDDPDHIYNYIKDTLGKVPEHYGIQNPYNEEFGDKSRGDLIDEIISLRKELEGWARADAMGAIGKYR